jgi:hypothetical protein
MRVVRSAIAVSMSAMPSKYDPSDPTDSPWFHIQSPDEVVATNIRRLRDSMNLSRVQLARKMSDLTGDEWSSWRLIDLEGARSSDQPPRPSRWHELISLALAFDVTVFELVLPQDADTRTQVSHQSTQVVLRPATGRTSEVGSTMAIDADRYSQVLFRLPFEIVTSDSLELARENLEYVRLAAMIEHSNDEMNKQVDRIKQLTGQMAVDKRPNKDAVEKGD